MSARELVMPFECFRRGIPELGVAPFSVYVEGQLNDVTKSHWGNSFADAVSHALLSPYGGRIVLLSLTEYPVLAWSPDANSDPYVSYAIQSHVSRRIGTQERLHAEIYSLPSSMTPPDIQISAPTAQIAGAFLRFIVYNSPQAIFDVHTDIQIVREDDGRVLQRYLGTLGDLIAQQEVMLLMQGYN